MTVGLGVPGPLPRGSREAGEAAAERAEARSPGPRLQNVAVTLQQ